MAKVDVGFRFSPEADARLKELAQIWNTTRTAWLEEVILSFDPDAEQEAARHAVVDQMEQHEAVVAKSDLRRSARKASAAKGKAEAERLLKDVTAPVVRGLGAVRPGVRQQQIPKPGWKK